VTNNKSCTEDTQTLGAISGVPRVGGLTPPEIVKALQNHAKLNRIVKTDKNC